MEDGAIHRERPQEGMLVRWEAEGFSVWGCAESHVVVGRLSEDTENSWIQEMNRGWGA